MKKSILLFLCLFTFSIASNAAEEVSTRFVDEVIYNFELGDITELSSIELDEKCKSVIENTIAQVPEQEKNVSCTISVKVSIHFVEVTISVTAKDCQKALKEVLKSIKAAKKELRKAL